MRGEQLTDVELDTVLTGHMQGVVGVGERFCIE
jgi:hypothetical protein